MKQPGQPTIRRALAACLFVAFLALPGTPGKAAATTTELPVNGRLVYSYLGRLIVANADGTGQWPLTPETLTYQPGDWAPDGSRLAILGEGQIHLVDPRGRTVARLTHVGTNVDPSFSADGSTIAFASTRDGRPQQVWVMNADGSSQRPVASEASDPSWAPDGRIAFAAFRDGNWEIARMNADGSDVRLLTRHPSHDLNPAWSPDGSRIAFESNRDGSSDIFTMSADGSDVRRLTTSSARDSSPEWSPDGRRIAFMSERSGAHAVFVMDSDGAHQTKLSSIADAYDGPAWQPLARVPYADVRQCTIWGTPADDLLVGTPRDDVICGLDGDDRLLGGEGDDTVVGASGRDSVVAGPGHDLAFGGPGDDLLDLRDSERDFAQGGDELDVALVDRGVDRVLGTEEAFDPDPRALTRGRPVRASFSLPDRPPEYAVDGHVRLIWGGHYAPQWIEIHLGRPSTISSLQLVVAQTPSGTTQHDVLGVGPNGRWRHLVSFRRVTDDGQVLRYTAPAPWQGIRRLRVVTPYSPSWVAWKEIRALAPRAKQVP